MAARGTDGPETRRMRSIALARWDNEGGAIPLLANAVPQSEPYELLDTSASWFGAKQTETHSQRHDITSFRRVSAAQ